MPFDNRASGATEGVVRVRLPRGKEMFGVVEAMLGNSRLQVRCEDNKLRIIRIPGKMRKRIWIRQKDLILVEPWDIQSDTRGDAKWKYRNAEVQWLKKKGILKMDI